LEGWRHSAPVRVGNGAWNQRQLDVYGELLSAVYRLSDHLFDNASDGLGHGRPDKWGAPPDLAPATRRFFVQLADTAARRWQEKDQGIWEVRGEPRDFLYSKLMCWVALDRAVALADRLDASDRVEAWKQTQAQIREAILTRGWSDRANAFTQSFGSDELDASNLMLPLVGFLPADDPRVLSTINATEERLTDERGLVYRYRSHDGLEGEEGTFLLCTFWLAQPWPKPDSRLGPAPSSNGPPPSSTTSACSPRRSIPSAESSWATSPKPSATSGSSTRPGPFLRGFEPVSDVDRAKGFYESLGWRLDADFPGDGGFRVVQLTPPGSACSVIFGSGITSAAPGSAEGLQLVVTDVEAARAEMIDRGVEVSDVFHDSGGVFHHAGTEARAPGPAPEHKTYGSFASFNDPDGNGWFLQEVTTRLPGR
jgi:catechol 2,3-dioxygenase-like lactoylglutathione lyase family enzyme